MKVEHRSVIYSAANALEHQRVAFFDSLLRLRNGTICSGFTVGRTKHDHQGTIRISRSRDGGLSWTVLPATFESRIEDVPGSITGAEMVETEPGKLLLFSTWFDRSDPERPLFNPETEGILRSRQLVAESRDEGESWSEWRTIATPGRTGTAVTGPPVHWEDGTIAFAFESFKEFDDPSPTRHGSWVIISRDGGRTFDRQFLVAQDPKHRIYYWDQRLTVAKAAGEFVGMFWTHDRDTQKDLRVHLLKGNIFDGEVAKQLPSETSIPGQIAAPLVWDDRQYFAFVVDRDRPRTMRLWRSMDGGKSWPESDSLIVHVHDEQARLSQGLTEIDYAQYWEDMTKWTFGHPCIRRFDENHLLLSYYAGVPGCMDIHAVRVSL